MGKTKHINEHLFYIQNKIHATAKDVLINSCIKFYSLEETTSAIELLETVLSTRISKRNKADDLHSKLLNDLYEKIWSLDAAATQIPKFLAADLSRVPRERENTESLASTEQLLASIHNLKSTVIYLQQKMVTRELLESSLAQLQLSSTSSATETYHPSDSSSSSSTAPPSTAPSPTSAAPSPSPPLGTPISTSNEPSTSGSNMASNVASNMTLDTSALLPPPPGAPFSPTAPSFSQVEDISPESTSVPSLGRNEYAEVIKKQNMKTSHGRVQRQEGKSKPSAKRGANSVIIGKKVNTGLLSFKGADLTVARYVGRVALGTTVDEIRSSLEQINVEAVSLTAITLNHNRFASFKLVVKRSQLGLIENPDFWPEGVIIGRWWSPKPPPTPSNPNGANPDPAITGNG